MTSGKWVTANPRHAVASLALNEMLTEVKALGNQVVNVFNCYGGDDDYKCWGQDFFFWDCIWSLTERNWKTQGFNLLVWGKSETHRHFIVLLK